LGEVENRLSDALKEQEELKKMYSERLDGVMTREAFDRYLEEEREKKNSTIVKKNNLAQQELEHYYGITKNDIIIILYLYLEYKFKGINVVN